MVTWHCKTKSGQVFSGSTEDGSWKRLKETIGDNIIVSLTILSDKGSGKIDNNKDGYLILNKVIGALGHTGQIDLVGIGYWNSYEQVVRTKWYNKDTMQLVFTEAKPVESVEQGLISFNKDKK